MANRVVRTRSFAGGVRRLTGWGPGPETGTDGGEQQITAAGSVLWSTGVLPTVEGQTIIRIRGMIELRIITLGTVGDGFNGAIGICVVEDRAATAGAASVPRPFTETGNEVWMWHQYFSIHPETTTVEANSSMTVYIPIDSKSMRKFGTGKICIGVLEAVNEVGVASMALYASSRILLKLP